MPVLDSIPAWLAASPYEAAAASATDSSASTCETESAPESTSVTSCPTPIAAASELTTSPKGEVPAKPGVGAPAFSPAPSTDSPSCSSSSASSPPDSPFATPPSPSPFPDCEALADTFLAKVAAGTECLAAIAAFHHIPYPRFTLWLLRPQTQERLAALSVAIASAARLTATAALPDIVRGLKTTVAQLQSQTHMTIAPPGANHLVAESIMLRRHRALIAAASLIYRISRFTCPSPTNQRTDVPSRSALGSRCSSRQREHPAAPRRALASLPRLDLSDSACHRDRPSEGNLGASPLDSASEPGTPQPPRNPDPETRNPTSFPTSDIVGGPLPTSDIDTGAPAFSSASCTSSPSSASRIPSVLSVSSVVQLESVASDRSIPTSDIPLPTSDISVDDALRILTAEYDLTAEEVAELRADSHSWIHDFIPLSAVATSATLTVRPAADDG